MNLGVGGSIFDFTSKQSNGATNADTGIANVLSGKRGTCYIIFGSYRLY